ncbi:MAG: AsmA family protein [Henriciella sp.]|nr:AsmA family protein [Henriciella sp.]
MKRIALIIGGLFAVLLAALIIVPNLIPSSVYKTQIEQAASTALDREVTLLGDASLSLFPSISAKIDGAQVANPEGFEGDYMIEAGELVGKVKLLPLLTGKVEISQVGLRDTRIRLEQLADGQANWVVGRASETEETTGGFETGIDRAFIDNASISFINRQTGDQYELSDFNAEARLTALDKPFSSSGDGRINGQAFAYDVALSTIDTLLNQSPADLTVELDTDYGRVSYDGALTLGEVPVVDGTFDVRSDTLGPIIEFIGAELPFNGNEIRSLIARGEVSGAATTPKIDFSRMRFEATGIELDVTGGFDLGEAQSISASVDLKTDRIERFLALDPAMMTAISALGEVDLQADLSGTLSSPNLTNIRLEQDSPVLRTLFSGGLSLGGGQTLDGALEVSSRNLRGLMNQLGVELPEGEQLETFSIEGQTQGSLSNPALNQATLQLDDQTATGSIGADLSGARPKVEADLTTGELDLTPFLGGEAAADTEPSLNEDWSDDPLALDSLTLVDADVRVSAQSVKLNQITLNDALLDAELVSGRLNASFEQENDKPGFRAFDGDWAGSLELDASKPTPHLEVDAGATGIAAQKLLSAFTGYGGMTGIGGVSLNLSSNGNSLKALVNDLDGTFDTELAEGAVAGVNLAQWARTAQNLSTLDLNNLSLDAFSSALSPGSETDFSSFLGDLEFVNGVATIDQLSLNNPVVSVAGSGSIDLGARTLNIRLVPSVDINAAGQGSSVAVNDIPIPVLISGSWTSPTIGPDYDMISTIVADQAKARVADEITSRVEGPIGSILGDVIAPGSTQEGEEGEATDLESQLRDEANSALGSLFGRSRDSDDETEED